MLVSNTPPLSVLSFKLIPPNASNAVYDSLENRGFDRNAILDDFTFLDRKGQNVKINALAYAHQTHRNPDHAGCTVYNATNGLTDKKLVGILSQTTAPFHLIHRNKRFSFWISGVSDGKPQPRQIHTDIPYHQLDNILSEYATDLKPERIVNVKRGYEQFQNPAFRDTKLLQLTLWVLNATGPLLVEHFGHTVNTLRAYGVGEDNVISIATQLLGATILADTGSIGKDVRKGRQNITLNQLIESAVENFPNYFQIRLFEKNLSASEEAYKILQEINYAGFAPDMLTDLYTQAYSQEQKKVQGRYDTPLYLTRRIWESIPVEFLPPGQRVVADMTCGWGSFLIAGYDRLSQLGDMQEVPLREYLHGNDKNAFTARLAGLGLLLSTSSDKWHVDAEDALTWRWLARNQPNIIVGNPPFRGSRKEHLTKKKKRYQKADQFLKKAINRLAPNGYLAMLMPQSFTAAEASPQLRKQLLESCDVLEIWDLPIEVFSEGTSNTVVLFARKKVASPRLSHYKPVRIRTVQKDSLGSFEEKEIFTASGIACDQSVWDENSRQLKNSTNTHIIEYKIILPEYKWEEISSCCLPLEEWTTIFSGAIVGKNPKIKRWKDYPEPRNVPWLTGAKTVMPSSFYIDYDQAQTIRYPNDLVEPRKNKKFPEKDKEHLLEGVKVLLTSDPNPSWGKRVKVAIERKGHFVSNNFWVVTLGSNAQEMGITHEVIAAVLNWYVSNAWVLEHITHPWIYQSTLKRIPFPRYLSTEDCIALTEAVQLLEESAIAKQTAPSEATKTIDTILKAAYQLDDETFERLCMVYEWDDNPQITIDPQPVSDEATWVISGVVDTVNANAGTITFWLDGFDKLQTVPITPAMPGWMLRPETAFRTKIPRECVQKRSLQDVVWGKFTPQNYTYLSEDELFDQLTSTFHSEGEEYVA